MKPAVPNATAPLLPQEAVTHLQSGHTSSLLSQGHPHSRCIVMVVKLFQLSASCSPSAKDDSFIYSLTPTSSNGLATLTSADELVLLDRSNLHGISAFTDVPTGVTCLQPGDKEGNVVICSGRDGTVAIFDVRTKTKTSQFKLGAIGYCLLETFPSTLPYRKAETALAYSTTLSFGSRTCAK